MKDTTNTLRPTGVHHVSALTNNIKRNHGFYTTVLGLRLVKKTVNQDDTSMYHLFYADAQGSPGTDLTFFDLPGSAQEHKGNNSVTLTTFLVKDEESLRYWAERLTEKGVDASAPAWRDGRLSLDFEDFDGLPLSLVAGGPGNAIPWKDSPVPPEHQLRGLAYPVVTVPKLEPTHKFLSEVFHLSLARTYEAEVGVHVHVYEMGDGGPAAEVHVAVRPDWPRAHYGSGGVHHVALRVPDEEQYHAWTAALQASGYRFSGEVDRHYFRSLYIREPNGILFELATDGPGFGTDETLDSLGQGLALPPFLEGRRAQIEAGLRPL